MKNLMKGLFIFLTLFAVSCSGFQLDTTGYVMKKDGSKIHVKGHSYFYKDTVVLCNRDENIVIKIDDVKEIKFNYGSKRIK